MLKRVNKRKEEDFSRKRHILFGRKMIQAHPTQMTQMKKKIFA